MRESAFLDGLNPEQHQAVTWPSGSVLVLAGAGSGKTRVLTTRIAWLVQTGQVTPAGILAVTFTNKAAKEMLARLSAMLPINPRGMWIGTFHGLCNRLLRAHHRDAGLPQLFTILNSQDQLAMIKRVLKQLGADTDHYEPRKVQAFINQNKDAGLRADRVETWDDYSRHLAHYYDEYDRQCQREGAVNFAELLLRSCELLERNALLREHYQNRFAHILVNEFQDTSALQYRWLKLLAGGAVFAVGDDDQSIYAFRGADVANMARFRDDMGVREVIKLTRNYRSMGTILDAANAVIAHNRERLGKDLWTEAGQGEPIRRYEAPDDMDEARFIVEEAQALHRDGMALTDIAVLYRANAQSRAIEHALFSAGVPYRVYGGLRFFERAEIKHALAYLRLVAQPDDDGALLRVINFPARGVGARSVETLSDAARAGGTSLWSAACTTGKKGAAEFVRLIESLRAQTHGLGLPEMVEIVVEQSGLIAHYQGEKDSEERLDNLRELTSAAAAFMQESEGEADLTAFLAHAALEAGDHEAEPGRDAVQLMTVHAAKGLEFHAVFIGGMEEGLFPHENALYEPAGLEEERRLMYVAITRARQRLYLTHTERRMLHGQTRYGIASRFFEEIPAHLVRRQGASAPRGFVAGANSAAAASVAPGASLPYPVGSRVLHARYGEGTVSGYQGGGSDAEIRIRFPQLGEKAFLLDYVKLTPA